jgi:hypothetical protein
VNRSVVTAILAAAAMFPVGATATTIVGTPATVTFTASSTGKSLEQLLNDQENGTADVIAYGTQLQTVVVPEPSAKNSLMLGAGFLLAGSIFRRRKTR